MTLCHIFSNYCLAIINTCTTLSVMLQTLTLLTFWNFTQKLFGHFLPVVVVAIVVVLATGKKEHKSDKWIETSRQQLSVSITKAIKQKYMTNH